MPASLDQFLAELRLLHRGHFGELIDRVSPEKGPLDVARLARELVRIRALTHYQAAALNPGKGRGLLAGPYVVLDRIGRGGMGMVFKAVDREGNTAVALRILPLHSRGGGGLPSNGFAARPNHWPASIIPTLSAASNT